MKKLLIVLGLVAFTATLSAQTPRKLMRYKTDIELAYRLDTVRFTFDNSDLLINTNANSVKFNKPLALTAARVNDTSGYEYGLNLNYPIVSVGSETTGAKSFGLNISMTRAAGMNTLNGDMEDALIKGSITNRATSNAASYIVRGINIEAKNRDGNVTTTDVNWLEGAFITAKNQTANTSTAEMRGLYARVDLDPGTSATTEVGAVKAELDLDANAPATSYGVQAYYQSAGSYTKPVAGFWVNAGSTRFWQYGLKIEAGKATTDIGLQNGEYISNATDGVISMGAANVRAATYNFADATAVGGTGDAITIDFVPDLGVLVSGMVVMFVAESSNTTATTLSIDGGDAKAVIENHDLSALDANDIRAGMVVMLVYDGTSWQQISQSGN